MTVGGEAGPYHAAFERQHKRGNLTLRMQLSHPSCACERSTPIAGLFAAANRRNAILRHGQRCHLPFHSLSNASCMHALFQAARPRQSAAKEDRRSVKVQALCPSVVRTDFHDIDGFGATHSSNRPSVAIAPPETPHVSLLRHDGAGRPCVDP